MFLLNPNGILVGPSGQINVNTFVGSTLNLSDENFMGGGALKFSGDSTAGIENLRTHLANSSRELLGLLNRPELTPEDISVSIRKTMERAKAPENVIEQGLTEVPKSGTTTELKAWIARHATNALTAEAQLDKLFPAAQMVSTGATITPMTGGSPQLATTPPGTIAGPSTMVQLPPGARYELSGRTDINNNPTVFVKDASGNIIGETTVPAGVSPGQLPTGAAPKIGRAHV